MALLGLKSVTTLFLPYQPHCQLGFLRILISDLDHTFTTSVFLARPGIVHIPGLDPYSKSQEQKRHSSKPRYDYTKRTKAYVGGYSALGIGFSN